jgi:predicted DNA-binding transcriptional regulator AlpA
MDDSKPIYTLSVKEFSELMQDNLKFLKISNPNHPIEYETDNVDIDWVSQNFNMPKSTIRSKVSKGEMPCKKRGKPLFFSKSEIRKWVENGKPKVTQEVDFAPEKKRKKSF